MIKAQKNYGRFNRRLIIIGWAYLWIRYRNKEKVRAVLKDKYNDSYQDEELHKYYIS